MQNTLCSCSTTTSNTLKPLRRTYKYNAILKPTWTTAKRSCQKDETTTQGRGRLLLYLLPGNLIQILLVTSDVNCLFENENFRNWAAVFYIFIVYFYIYCVYLQHHIYCTLVKKDVDVSCAMMQYAKTIGYEWFCFWKQVLPCFALRSLFRNNDGARTVVLKL